MSAVTLKLWLGTQKYVSVLLKVSHKARRMEEQLVEKAMNRPHLNSRKKQGEVATFSSPLPCVLYRVYRERHSQLPTESKVSVLGQVC